MVSVGGNSDSFFLLVSTDSLIVFPRSYWQVPFARFGSRMYFQELTPCIKNLDNHPIIPLVVLTMAACCQHSICSMASNNPV